MVSFPVLCFLVLCAFLACLGLFALAVTKVVAPDGRGHARGPGGGCAAALALLLLLGLGMTGLAATVAAIGVGSVVDWNPIRRIEIARTRHEGARSFPARTDAPDAEHDEREEHEEDVDEDEDDYYDDEDEDGAVSARFTVRGDAGADLVELLHDLVDVDLAELGDGLTIRHHDHEEGGEFSVYEFRLPISEKELARFERELRDELDGLELRLPERVDIEFEGAD